MILLIISMIHMIKIKKYLVHNRYLKMKIKKIIKKLIFPQIKMKLFTKIMIKKLKIKLSFLKIDFFSIKQKIKIVFQILINKMMMKSGMFKIKKINILIKKFFWIIFSQNKSKISKMNHNFNKHQNKKNKMKMKII